MQVCTVDSWQLTSQHKTKTMFSLFICCIFHKCLRPTLRACLGCHNNFWWWTLIVCVRATDHPPTYAHKHWQPPIPAKVHICKHRTLIDLESFYQILLIHNHKKQKKIFTNTFEIIEFYLFFNFNKKPTCVIDILLMDLYTADPLYSQLWVK